jgi:hypothetical protein
VTIDEDVGMDDDVGSDRPLRGVSTSVDERSDELDDSPRWSVEAQL